MVRYDEIWPTRHYLERHSKDVPFEEVVAIMFQTKNPKKKGDCYEINTSKVYILYKTHKKIAWIINAKRK